MEFIFHPLAMDPTRFQTACNVQQPWIGDCTRRARYSVDAAHVDWVATIIEVALWHGWIVDPFINLCLHHTALILHEHHDQFRVTPRPDMQRV